MNTEELSISKVHIGQCFVTISNMGDVEVIGIRGTDPVYIEPHFDGFHPTTPDDETYTQYIPAFDYMKPGPTMIRHWDLRFAVEVLESEAREMAAIVEGAKKTAADAVAAIIEGREKPFENLDPYRQGDQT